MKRVAWVIGGSGGIGGSIALGLAEDGFAVAIGFYRQQKRAHEVRELCEQRGVAALSTYADVRSQKELTTSYAEIMSKLGCPEVLVYAAGLERHGLLQEMTALDYEEVMAVNLRGAFYATQVCLPDMLRHKQGRLIFLSSIWGQIGGAGEVLYSAAKGGLQAFVKALGKEVAPSKICVNAIAPGAIATNMLHRQLEIEELEHVRQAIPMDRLGEVEEVSSLARYLVSTSAGYITGQIFHVNGGWYA